MKLFKLLTSLENKNIFEKNIKTMVLNFGPQHPASHGVLRLVVQLNGEFIEKIDTHIGFLHRGTEKLMESKNLIQAAPYLDRLDYTSVLTQTHAYCLAVENLNLQKNLNFITKNIRTIFDELSRTLNHLLAIAAHSLDVGSMAQLFWAFEDRERIMELFEYVSGARMHTALYLPMQNLEYLITEEFILKTLIFLKNCHKSYTEVYISLFNHRVWKLRLVNVGILNYDIARLFGATGPMLRSAGYLYDLRMSNFENYALYNQLVFKSFIGITGDCFDRFLIRSRELFESTQIIYQCITKLNISFMQLNTVFFVENNNFQFQQINYIFKNKMECLINKFKNITDGLTTNTGLMYRAVESGKGEFGVFIVITSNNKIYRAHLRSPAYNHLQLVSLMCIGHMFADLVTILGSIDVVFGEVDR